MVDENMSVTAKSWVTAHAERPTPMMIADHLWAAYSMCNLCTEQKLAHEHNDSAMHYVREAVMAVLRDGCGYRADIAIAIIEIAVNSGESIRYAASYWDDRNRAEKAQILNYGD